MTTSDQPTYPTRPLDRLQNPVAVKELRGRMRGSRAFVVLTLYLALMAGVVALVYLAYTANTGGASGINARSAGKGIFAAVLGIQVLLVVFIGPAFTAGAISGERERQTYDLLRTTTLPARSVVLGKLTAALSYVFLLVLASVPLQSIAFLLGGLTGTELVLSQVIILVAAVTYALFGLFCSATLHSTLGATVATLAGTLFVTFGVPLIVFALALIFGAALGPLSGALASGWVGQAVLQYAGLALAGTNLPATLIVSELIYLEQNALLAYNQLISGTNVWFPSPWPLFIALHVVVAIVLFSLTTARVRRTSEE